MKEKVTLMYDDNPEDVVDKVNELLESWELELVMGDDDGGGCIYLTVQQDN